MSPSKNYKNPPIDTAVVDFRFKPSPEWDPTIPGRVHAHELISNQYSGKPTSQKVFETAVQANPDRPPAIAVREGIGSVELPDKEGKKLIAFSKEGLSVVVIKPYDGWQMFRARVSNALKAYQECDPSIAIVRIGVRYTNKFSLPVTGENIGSCIADHFQFGPGLKGEMHDSMTSFKFCTEHKYDDGCNLILNFASLGPVPSNQQEHEFILDLDVFQGGLELSASNEIMELVDGLHEKEGVAFEGSIQEKTRGLIDV